MRKSERIRLMEMELIRLRFELSHLDSLVSFLIDMNGSNKPDLDAGKWYERKIDGNR